MELVRDNGYGRMSAVMQAHDKTISYVVRIHKMKASTNPGWGRGLGSWDVLPVHAGFDGAEEVGPFASEVEARAAFDAYQMPAPTVYNSDYFEFTQVELERIMERDDDVDTVAVRENFEEARARADALA